MAGQIERQRERFETDPADRVAFEALEEQFFLHGAWSELTALYERRLGAEPVQVNPAESARILFRLGQVLEERCQNPDRAVECYRRAIQLEPSFRPPVRQLRRLHAARGQWEVALQLADVEGRTRMRPYERAEFLVEMGSLWLRKVGDAEQAIAQFEHALAEVPDQEDALVGLARALEELGRLPEAAETWQRVVERVRGPDRAPALVARARLLEALGRGDKAPELYRAALQEDPRHREAVDALAELAAAGERWEELASLLEQRFDLAAGAIRRAAIALDAGRLHLDRLGDLAAARRWFSRALELFPDDPSVHLALGEVERRAGRPDVQARHLERALDLAEDDDGSPEVLLQAARSSAESGDPEAALAQYRRAAQQVPESRAALDCLDQALVGAGRDAERVDVLERRAALADAQPEQQAAALVELGRIHDEHIGDLHAARDAYERARRAHPARPGLAAALDRVLVKLGDWEGRRRLLEDAVASAPAAEQPELYVTLGEMLFEREGDSAAASRAFDRALALEPGSPRALAGLARVAAASGDEDSLLRTYEREVSITRDRERLAALAREIVRVCEARGSPERALPSVEWWVRTAPGESAPLQELARLQEELGRTDELVETLQRLDAVLSGPERAGVRRRLGFLHAAEGWTSQAIDAWFGALELDPNDPRVLEALGHALAEENRHREQAEVLRHLAEQLPPAQRGRCLADLGRLLSEHLGDPVGAMAALERAIESGSDAPEVSERLEALLEQSGRHEDLLRRLEQRRARLDDEAPEALALDLRRARLLLDALGRSDEAAALYRELRRRAPHDPAVLDGLEQAARSARDGTSLADLLEARAARESDPERRARLQLERARVLEETLEQLEEAREVYATLADGPGDAEGVQEAASRLEALLERVGDHAALCERLEARIVGAGSEERAELHLRVGRIARERLGERARAIYHLEAAASLRPERAEAWTGLARLYEEMDRLPELLRALEGELAAGPTPERELALRARAGRLCAGPLEDPARAEQHFRRVLEIDPVHPEAGEFVVACLEREERFAEMLPILEARLRGFEEDPDPQQGERRTSLRLRLAALRADRAGDLDGAIELLEAALREMGAMAAVTAPLADLYERAGRGEALVALCRQAAEVAELPAERAEWRLRLGHALRARGAAQEAAQALRAVLVERPDDRSAREALRDLYRELDEPEPLVRLLEYELRHCTGASEIPLRRELAELTGQRLERPADALAHLRRVLELGPGDWAAREQALALAEQLDRPEEAVALIDAALERDDARRRHADLWARRGALLGEALGRLDAAADSYRRAIELDPGRAGLRRELRRALEALERWPELLECLRRDADLAQDAERVALLEQGARMAEQHLDDDAALAWYEQLRVARPHDPGPLFRIADLHRRGDRPEALERALAEAARRLPEGDRRRDLELERAHVLEHRLGSPARALAALEEARRIDPEHPQAIHELERLYDVTGRGRELAALLAARISSARGEERTRLLGRIASLHTERLHDPGQAVETLRSALTVADLPAAARIDLLRRLGEALCAAGRTEEWAGTAEQELEALPADEPVFRERRAALHLELARSYERELARPRSALRHLRALVDDDLPEHAEEPWVRRDEAEGLLIDLLRAEGNHVELARRLAERLVVEPDPEGWLELARLREERLWAPAAAADAYREVLQHRPACPDALRGLRRVCERIADWAEVARTLERELAADAELSAPERAALGRRLGQVCWHRLGDTTRASRAFAAALEAEPRDRVSLRTLQSLFEAMGDWRGALDLYASELDLLGEDETARRQELWLKRAALARERLDDPEEASRAFAAAADLGHLPVRARAAWARLLERLGHRERHADVFASWCDDPETDAQATDLLRLANALEELGRGDEALARLERAVEMDPGCGEAWARLARLRTSRGEAEAAAQAWAKRGELAVGGEAAQAFCAAAAGCEATDPERAVELLERGIAQDATSAVAHARLARLAARVGRHEQALRVAARALELAAGDDDLAAAERVETALVGAQSARQVGDVEQVERLASMALALAPDHAEALRLRGVARHARGDRTGARRDLEMHLAASDAPDRADSLELLASVLEAEGDAEGALVRYREALGLQASREEAQAGMVRLLEQLGRPQEAARTLRAWADATPDGRARAERLVHAARLEHAARGGMTEVERLLREALAADTSHAPAWQQLVELLWNARRHREALEAATRALEQVGEPRARAPLLELRARALEREGRIREAAEAYGETAEAEPAAAAAALTGARLLRGLGDWRGAADLLAGFAENADEAPDRAATARVLLQLGRLRAGPLEDIDGATTAYRRALALAPELGEAEEALAGLLTHRPDAWDEAVERHVQLLAVEPARVASIRDLVRIARGRKASDAEPGGLAILRALGAASPEERSAAPARLPFRVASAPALSDPVFEAVRRAVCEAAPALAEAMGASRQAGIPASEDPLSRFRHARLAAEGELSAPALVPLPARELKQVLHILIRLAHEQETIQGDGHLVNALSSALGRRQRRRLRRAFGELAPARLEAVEAEAWRSELRALADAVALDRTGGDLRHALCALLADASAAEVRGLPPEADLTPWLAEPSDARRLIERVVRVWTARVSARRPGGGLGG